MRGDDNRTGEPFSYVDWRRGFGAFNSTFLAYE